MAEFVDALTRRLVPACDPGVVGAVFATAAAGYTGPRARDGRRASALTPSGVPFEVNISVGDDRTTPALRYVTETAAGQAFFRPRLEAQMAALDRLVGWLPEAAASSSEHRDDPAPVRQEVQQFVDLLFPDPGAVPARTRFATFVGVVHQDDVPEGVAWLKVYGNLAGQEGALERLAGRWAAFGSLAGLVADRRRWAPAFAALEISAWGDRRFKLYCRPRVDDRSALDLLAARCGTDADGVLGTLTELGVTVGRWPKVLVGCEAAGATAGRAPRLAVYFPGKSLGCDPRGMADLVRRLTGRDEAHRRADPWLDAVEAAARGTVGDGWEYPGVGVGLRPGGAAGKLNLYVVADTAGGVLSSTGR